MRRRRAIVVSIVSIVTLVLLGGAMPRMVEESLPQSVSHASTTQTSADTNTSTTDASAVLNTLPVKGRAAKTGYARSQFGNGWATTSGCSTRDIILHRDLENSVLDGACKVIAGTLSDPYTGKVIAFTKEKSAAVQIDHVVALSDAWQTGAQALSKERRMQLANDPLELLAVDGPANQAKGDGDAATWLPSNKPFRCEYVARQVAIKQKYALWVTQAEKDAIAGILASCPRQALP